MLLCYQLDMAKWQRESHESNLCNTEMLCYAQEAKLVNVQSVEMAWLKEESKGLRQKLKEGLDWGRAQSEGMKQKLKEAGETTMEDTAVYLPLDHSVA